jgi:hypothetical protein
MNTLIILFIISLFLSWMTLMRIWWKKERGLTQEFSEEHLLSYSKKGVRLTRRLWYRFTFYGQQVLTWLQRKLAKVFFSIFPNAAPAFAKKDGLVGLKHGPSSFFLKTISEKEEKKTRRRQGPIA